MQLVPYIHFPGNAEGALYFYKDVFAGEIIWLTRYADAPVQVDEADKQKIVHARLTFGKTMLMLGDELNTSLTDPCKRLHINIEIPDALQLKNVFDKLIIGGRIEMPLGLQYWGGLFGIIEDKYGVVWRLHHEILAGEK